MRACRACDTLDCVAVRRRAHALGIVLQRGSHTCCAATQTLLQRQHVAIVQQVGVGVLRICNGGERGGGARLMTHGFLYRAPQDIMTHGFLYRIAPNIESPITTHTAL
jgi:hypothetical protein